MAAGDRATLLGVGTHHQTVLEIEGREVVITNPDKVFFPRTGHTKLDLVNYYLAVADGAAARRGRPADGA